MYSPSEESDLGGGVSAKVDAWVFRLLETTMSNPYLPAEMLDHVVDHSYDTKPALRNCCLVSKSWIPHTRRHLFTYVELQTRRNLESWKETFPDPSTSPACYAKTLSINPYLVTAADAETGGWIRGFSRTVRMEVGSTTYALRALPVSLVPFHKFSPIKDLYMVFFHRSIPASFRPRPFVPSS